MIDEIETEGKSQVDLSGQRVARKQLLQGAGVGVLGIFAALHGAGGIAAADELGKGKAKGAAKTALGAWHITVHVDGTPTSFDAMYAFAPGGTFIRVDGRNNATSVGLWRQDGLDIVFGFLVFSFSASGQRVGTITALARATVKGGKISGPFSAAGVDMNSQPLAGFPKTGTFEGTRIIAAGP